VMERASDDERQQRDGAERRREPRHTARLGFVIHP